ncbi:methyl-accepting chemotaxis protein [Rhodospirillum centenum]|uniref:Methyl-accepting chemotaxis protein, putative n=1 Tax=Rhodospirillum centenum (strain ATCC 51521 / SW) TaxID=414684 RepID=B6IXZ3_RHOCS|nr:methyl-accepting chemotaxis protein [Rhodospirillum centenum]ACJ01167.1 methyl-accepting chemotaxis protein, putative [Rhodospirillum centenum SW]
MSEQPRLPADALILPDTATLDLLREAAPVIRHRLPAILDDFYRQVAADPRLARHFRTPAEMERAKKAQLAHWTRLVGGDLDGDYRASVQRVGRRHLAAHVPPVFYMAGYLHLIRGLLDALAEDRGGLLTRRATLRHMVRLQNAVVSAAMADMALSLSTYWEGDAEKALADVNHMVDSIGDQSVEVVNSIHDYTDDLARAVGSLTTVCGEVGERATQASSAAAQSSAAAETVAAAAEELDASIAEIAHQVAQSTGAARDAIDRTGKAAEAVRTLGEAAREIGGIVTLIGDIAAQTNLLALNATIEAARAGEAGKGFAIVAGEVKALATQSARAADEISGRIAAIQGETAHVATAIEAMAGVVHRIEDVGSSISAAVEEQASATGEIARTVAEVADAARSVTELMDAVVTSTDLAKRAVHTVEASTEHLREAIDDLPRHLVRSIRTSSRLADRRVDHRRPVLVDGMLTVEGQQRACMIHDLSCHGAALDAAAPPPAGSPVTLHVPRLDRTLEATVVALSGSCTLHLKFAGSGLDAAEVELVATESARQITLLAKQDHAAFVEQVEAAVAGRIELDAADLSTHHTCRLGRWYDAVNDPDTRALPSYVALADPHARVHSAGRRALLAHLAGRDAEAAAAVRDMRDASDAVMHLLDRLAEECASLRGHAQAEAA